MQKVKAFCIGLKRASHALVIQYYLLMYSINNMKLECLNSPQTRPDDSALFIVNRQKEIFFLLG